MRDQMTKLQGSLKERDNSNQQLDMAIDQMKRSNLELELTAKEKEVSNSYILVKLTLTCSKTNFSIR